jgi:soluble lytic murein transglycosylase-like protein
MERKFEDKEWDHLFMRFANRYKLPWRLIKSQCWQESKFDPGAVSKCGARGLMQLMPDTDFQLNGKDDGFDPAGNIENGCRYDKWLFDKFPEIPDVDERLKFMLASYNGGKAYINAALKAARLSEFGDSKLTGAPEGLWQLWEYSKGFLFCVRVDGKAPEGKQIQDYVDRIWRLFVTGWFKEEYRCR